MTPKPPTLRNLELMPLLCSSRAFGWQPDLPLPLFRAYGCFYSTLIKQRLKITVKASSGSVRFYSPLVESEDDRQSLHFLRQILLYSGGVWRWPPEPPLALSDYTLLWWSLMMTAKASTCSVRSYSALVESEDDRQSLHLLFQILLCSGGVWRWPPRAPFPLSDSTLLWWSLKMTAKASTCSVRSYSALVESEDDRQSLHLLCQILLCSGGVWRWPPKPPLALSDPTLLWWSLRMTARRPISSWPRAWNRWAGAGCIVVECGPVPGSQSTWKRRECLNINFLSFSMPTLQRKIPFMYSFSGNCTDSVPITTVSVSDFIYS